MALQTINIGNLANDGTGDDLREAFIKVNNNFTELNNVIISTDTDGQNLGAGEGIYNGKLDATLQFKSLQAGSGISLNSSGSTITITGNPGIESLIITTDSGSIQLPGGNRTIPLYGGTNINTRHDSGNLYIDVDGTDLVALDTNPRLGGTLNANSKDILGAKDVSALRFLGNLEGLVNGIDVRELNDGLINFDLGGINTTATSVIEFIILTTDFDFGSFANPLPVSVDGGTI